MRDCFRLNFRWMCASLVLIHTANSVFADLQRGAVIYKERCASCHGASGEGVADVYPEQLLGDLSVKELAKYIDKTMPEGEAEKCVGKDADDVAEFIHESFYSITAQFRNRPPRIDLSRLTVRQYKNSVADLIGSFSQPGYWGDERGLKGNYYKSRNKRRENRLFERTDHVVDVNFGETLPDGSLPEKKEGEEKPEPIEFAADWNGSVLATESGLYEFLFVTENAGQLWVNDMDVPLIDARVKSGDEKEHRGSIELLAGRVYSLRLEFSRSKSEKTASVQLKWKPPLQAEELIPSRALSTYRFPEVLVVETPFPPDDKSVGYERGVSVSAEWNEATTFAAIEVADKVIDNLRTLANLPREEDQREQKLREFCQKFVERAFRRPLTDGQKDLYIERQFKEAPDDNTAVKRIILLTLKSPRFLFPGAAADKFDDYRVAEWLALTLWDSIPDDKLLQAAAEGALNTREQIEAQAKRMADDPRAKAKVRGFFHQWLHFDHFHELSKKKELYPEFDQQIASDLRTSLELFIEDTFWSENSDYRKLLLADAVYLNPRLAKFYGVDLPEELDDFVPVKFDSGERAGILSHPYLLTGLAYDDVSSPIHRGVFLARSLLGRFLKPPPIAVTPVAAELHPDMTTRERVAMQTSSANCMSCHGMINQLGFSLEEFDAVGRFRTQEREQKVDASGQYITRDGQEFGFEGARGLAEFLSQSDESHSAFTEQLFQYATKQPIQAFGPEMLPRLRGAFQSHDLNMRFLWAEIATESVLEARKQSSGTSP